MSEHKVEANVTMTTRSVISWSITYLVLHYVICFVYYLQSFLCFILCGHSRMLLKIQDMSRVEKTLPLLNQLLRSLRYSQRLQAIMFSETFICRTLIRVEFSECTCWSILFLCASSNLNLLEITFLYCSKIPHASHEWLNQDKSYSRPDYTGRIVNYSSCRKLGLGELQKFYTFDMMLEIPLSFCPAGEHTCSCFRVWHLTCSSEIRQNIKIFFFLIHGARGTTEW